MTDVAAEEIGYGSKTLRKPVYIAGSGHFFPEPTLTNADLEGFLDTTDAWILAHTGIRERRRAPIGMDTSDLGVRAVTSALQRTSWRAEDLQLLVCSTSTPDQFTPSTASYIGHKLSIDPVAFDVGAACSGFVYGLSVAQAMMLADGYGKVAVCAAEKFTKVTDYTDRSTAILFGDGAACVLLQPDVPEVGFEIVDVRLRNEHVGANLVVTPTRGYFRQVGKEVVKYALAGMRDQALDMLARHGLATADIRGFIFHQANLRILEQVAAAVGVEDEQHWHDVEWAGNQSSAGVATTLCDRIEHHSDELRHGDLVMMTTYGSGFTSGCALLRRIDRRPPQSTGGHGLEAAETPA